MRVNEIRSGLLVYCTYNLQEFADDNVWVDYESDEFVECNITPESPLVLTGQFYSVKGGVSCEVVPLEFPEKRIAIFNEFLELMC